MDIVKRECFRPASNGLGEVFTRIIRPEKDEDVRAAVQIAHGMAEHSGRYEQFGCYLAEQGFAVYANDHAGHGRSVGPAGYFGSVNGWQNMVEDMRTLTEGFMKKDVPTVPVFLIGHSMGSMLARSYMARYARTLSGVVLIGPPPPNHMAPFAQDFCHREAVKNGQTEPNPTIMKAMSHTFNRQIRQAESPNEWICRDESVVQAFDGDPMCGFPFTNRGYYDLVTGLKDITGREWARQVPDELPVLILAGKEDAVAGYGSAPKRIARQLREGGVHSVTTKVYEGARHELLNELNRQEVYEDIRGWLNGILSGEEKSAQS